MLSLQSYGNAALKLHENGYIPIPIIPATKRPSIKNWSSIKNDYAQIEKLSLEYPHAGVGILLNYFICSRFSHKRDFAHGNSNGQTNKQIYIYTKSEYIYFSFFVWCFNDF